VSLAGVNHLNVPESQQQTDSASCILVTSNFLRTYAPFVFSSLQTKLLEFMYTAFLLIRL
jgi:hypothetical protein